MPIATGSPNHSNTPLPTDNTKSSTSSRDYSSDDSSMERGSPLGSPASPLSPMYNFEPVYNKTVGTPQHSQPSQLGAQLGDSRPSLLPHRRLKDMLKGGAGGATSRLAASPLAEKTAETQISDQNLGSVSEARVMGSQDWAEYAREEEEDVEAAIRSGDVIEGEEGQEQGMPLKARIVAVDFDGLCAQYMPKDIGGREVKFTTDVLPYAVSDLYTPYVFSACTPGIALLDADWRNENYKEHVFYLNRGWGTAADIQREIKHVDLSMIPLQIGNPSPVDVEPGFITAFKCLKAFGYAIHIFTVRPKPFEAEIEAFLKIYGITVGVAAEDEVAAIWSGRAATGEVRDITSKDLEKEAVFKGKMMRLLGGGYDVETIRLINPSVVLADTSANSPPFKHPEAPEQDPDHASPTDRNFGVNILTFGKCVKPGRTVYTDEVEMGMAMSRVRGWVGVVNYLQGMEEDRQGDLLRLDMAEAVACQSIASED